MSDGANLTVGEFAPAFKKFLDQGTAPLGPIEVPLPDAGCRSRLLVKGGDLTRTSLGMQPPPPRRPSCG